MPLYRVKDGLWFGAYREHGGGSVVELTEEQASAFLDKLDPVAEVKVPRNKKDPAPTTTERPPAEGAEGLAQLPPDVQKALVLAGYNSDSKIVEATDTELKELSGIGPATLRHIRKVTAQ